MIPGHPGVGTTPVLCPLAGRRRLVALVERPYVKRRPRMRPAR